MKHFLLRGVEALVDANTSYLGCVKDMDRRSLCFFPLTIGVNTST